MEIKQEEIGNGVLKVTLIGSFDIAGSGDVDMPMSVIAGSRDKLIIDFSEVSFLASIGVRVLVKTARAIGNRGGKVAIINPNASARKVLASTGVDTIVSVVDDEAAALAAVG